MKNKVIMLVLFMFVFLASISNASAQTEVYVKTNSSFYEIGSAVEISGSAKDPSSNEVILTIYNNKAEQIWHSIQQLDDQNIFDVIFPLSGTMWEQSNFYVITAKIDDKISATTFELLPPQVEKVPVDESTADDKTITPKETMNTPKPTPPQEDLQRPFLTIEIAKIFYDNSLMFTIGLVIFVVAVIGVAYSRKIPKNVTRLMHKPLPMITFENPAPSQVHLKNNQTMSYEGWINIPIEQRPDIMSLEFWITIKNIGGDAARNISRVFIKDNNITREHLEKYVGESLPDLAPGDFYYQDFKIDQTHFNKLDKEDFFVELLVSYDKEKSQKSYSGVIFGITKESVYVVDEWFK